MRQFLFAACLAAAFAAAPPALAEPLVYKLHVDGLACPFCSYGIEKKLKATAGVDSIQVDINTGVVRVTMAEGASLSESQASQIVAEAGFTLRAFAKARGNP